MAIKAVLVSQTFHSLQKLLNIPVVFVAGITPLNTTGLWGYITRNWGAIPGISKSILYSIGATPASVPPAPHP